MTDESKEMDLEELRQKIDAIDQKLLVLINDRASYALQVADAKMAVSGGAAPVFYRPDREARVLRNLISQNSGPMNAENLALIFRQIMSACLALEEPMRVAYLGPEGTFTQQATLKHFGKAVLGQPMVTVDDIFREVASENVHYGVVPVENSSEGVISHTLDNFLSSSLRICGEAELRVHHHLMALPVAADRVEKIYSHQQTLGQCRHWLDSHYPNVPRVAASSNAQAAMMAMEDGKAAAIAGEIAAQIYELDILARNIEDQVDNTTRFIIVGREDVAPSGCDKTSIMVSMENKPGALFRVLEPFHRSGVSLTSIETRPSKAGRWSYVFFIDFEGHASDQNIQELLKVVDRDALEVKLLGSYPRALRV